MRKLIMAALCMATAASAQQGVSDQAKKIFDRHMAAIGGARAQRASVDEHRVSVIEMPGNQEMRVESFRSGNRFLNRTTIPGIGTSETGFDGRTAWTVDLLGPRLLSPDSVAETLGSVVRPTPPDTKAAVVGSAYIDGKLATAVMVTAKGQSIVQYYDQESGLLVAQTPRYNPIRADTIGMFRWSDYKRFGDVSMPTVTTFVGPRGQRMVIRVINVDHKPVDPALFTMPASVQALVKP